MDQMESFAETAQESFSMNLNSMQEKILALLGNGVSPDATAMAVGVENSYISQLLGREDFSARVTQLRFDRLQKSSEIDKSYDELESMLLEKLHGVSDYLLKPSDILMALRIVNGAQRRGAGISQATHIVQNIVQLNMPAKLIQHFRTDEQNQVIEVEGQQIGTIPANVLMDQVKKELQNADHNMLQGNKKRSLIAADVKMERNIQNYESERLEESEKGREHSDESRATG